MFLRLRILAVLITVVFSGCQQSGSGNQADSNPKTFQTVSSEEPKPVQEKPMIKRSNYQYKGTIHYLNLEGGFYGIVTDKGEKLLPIGLEKKYFVDGTVISFSGNYKEGMMTIQQWGKPFRVEKVQLISLGKNTNNPEA